MGEQSEGLAMIVSRWLIVATVILASQTAEAQQPATLTLACKGTTEYSYPDGKGSFTHEKPLPVEMGIIVNFTKRTVQGFSDPSFIDIPVRITAANDVTVTFEGSDESLPPTLQSISGSIDRVTGTVYATIKLSNTEKHEIQSMTNYELRCRPAQRMF
jgi:hypothetical protein